MLAEALRQWFVRHHGEGAKHQADVYRCLECQGLVTWNKIRRGETCCAGRLRMTNPTWWESFRLLALPWSV